MGQDTRLREKEMLAHATTWMDLEDVLNEINPSRKNKYRLDAVCSHL
jgi:hypothetical protein